MFKRMAIVLGLAGVLTSAAPALAQAGDGPPPVVQRCIGQVHEVTESAVARINFIALNGVQRVRQLDQNDAPVPVMIASTRSAQQSISEVAENQITRVNTIVGACIRTLSEAGAPEPLKQVILQVGRHGKAAIGFAAATGKAALNHALGVALADEQPPGDGNGAG